MSLRGYVISRTGVLPTDPRFRELSSNDLLLRFTVHWLRKRESDLMNWATKVLGVVWSRDEVRQMSKTSMIGDEVFIPLSIAVNNDLPEHLKKMFSSSGSQIGGGDYKPAPGEEIVELGEMPVDEFKRWAAQAMGVVAERNDNVTLRNDAGAAADPKIERMREQIAHSKRMG